eukprot:766722_1
MSDDQGTALSTDSPSSEQQPQLPSQQPPQLPSQLSSQQPPQLPSQTKDSPVIQQHRQTPHQPHQPQPQHQLQMKPKKQPLTKPKKLLPSKPHETPMKKQKSQAELSRESPQNPLTVSNQKPPPAQAAKLNQQSQPKLPRKQKDKQNQQSLQQQQSQMQTQQPIPPTEQRITRHGLSVSKNTVVTESPGLTHETKSSPTSNVSRLQKLANLAPGSDHSEGETPGLDVVQPVVKVSIDDGASVVSESGVDQRSAMEKFEAEGG